MNTHRLPVGGLLIAVNMLPATARASTYVHKTEKGDPSIVGAQGVGRLIERQVSVRTCGALYQCWKKTIPHYRHAPDEGIVVNVPFVTSRIDPAQPGDPKRPLAVLLHGAPGSYRDFSKNLIPRLRARGVDVLSPNYPDMAFSFENKFFWHSVEERTALLIDFFKTLGIKSIDTLVAHSASFYPALRILLEEKEAPQVKSFASLAPNTPATPMALKPTWFIWQLVEMYRNPALRPIVEALAPITYYLGLSPLKPVPQTLMLSLTTYLKSGHRQGESLLRALASRKLPTLVVISENDRLLSYKDLLELCNMLGTANNDIWHFDKDGQLKSPGKAGSWLKVVNFEKGSHYPFLKHPDACAEEIIQLLQRIHALP